VLPSSSRAKKECTKGKREEVSAWFLVLVII
jgi:hypothetical protein